jgi:hypothetical protein
MGVVVLLLLAARRQHSRSNDWANPRQHDLFVLVCIDSSKHTNTQSLYSILSRRICLYWYVLLCIVFY